MIKVNAFEEADASMISLELWGFFSMNRNVVRVGLIDTVSGQTEYRTITVRRDSRQAAEFHHRVQVPLQEDGQCRAIEMAIFDLAIVRLSSSGQSTRYLLHRPRRRSCERKLRYNLFDEWRSVRNDLWQLLWHLTG